jgi:outer membrane protein TolC
LLALEVRQTYFQLISATNARETEKKGLEDLEKERDSLKGQAKDGFITQGIVTSADARIESYKLQMRGSENAYQAKWKLFRQLTGIDALQLSSALPREVSPVPAAVGEQMEKLSEKANGYRPAILVNADDNIRTEQLNYEIYKTRLKPQLGVSLSMSQSNATPDNNVLGQKQLVTAYGASANVNWSIFDGFTTQALKRNSLIRIRQLKIARDQAELDYADSLKNQVESMRIGWINLKKTEEALLSARSNVEIVQKDFEVGMVPQQALDVAKAAAEATLQAANTARGDYYIQIVNYLSLKGKDPAVTPSAKK